jgi:pimeloyl-ACP methyl ester carboxylesterase
MAEDVICLLDYLGWTADRELNIVGTSLGGMIAQGQ